MNSPVVLLLSLVLLVVVSSCHSSSENKEGNSYHIIPKPASLTPSEGAFTIDNSTRIIVKSDTSLNAKAIILQKLIAGKGINLMIGKSSSENNIIVFEIDNQIEHEEGYHLSVSEKAIAIKAKSAAGAFYAIQTLRQLSPMDLETENSIQPGEWTIPFVEIKDSPRFPYRGMHLDVARHFFPLSDIKDFIDQLAYHKMNRFHWHLTEDQGWRIEIKKYPLLTEVSAFRKETLIGHANDRPKQFDGKHYGGFYTQKEIKEVVRYAKERHITIIPEIEMPGHSQAALAAYPQLACTEGPFEVATEWGIFEEVYCPKEGTFRFLENVLTEVMTLFPGEYIHVGGDECPKTRWKACADCQNLIKREGLKNEDGLQSYFIRRIEKFLNANGRKIIGWDEILEGGLAPNATVMSWRGVNGGIEAAGQGHDVIMTPTSHCYFDYYQADHPDEPLAIGGLIPLSKVYGFEPVPEALTREESKHILGAQGNIWTEYIPTRKQLDYMAFPRLSAMAEVNWTPKDQKDYKDFTVRLTTHLERLKAMGIRPANHMFDVKMKILSGEGKGVEVVLFKEAEKGKILLSLDGSVLDDQSETYSGPIRIAGNSSILAQAFEGDQALGRSVQQDFKWHLAAGKSIIFDHPPAEKYSAAGTGSVVNAVRGSTERYGDAEWLGFEGKDAIATIDFGESHAFSSVTLHFFKGEPQWIYLPREILIYTSEDGINFRTVAEKKQVKGDTKVVAVPVMLENAEGHYLKIHVKRYGIIPEGKQGAGHEAWLFVDEIVVE